MKSEFDDARQKTKTAEQRFNSCTFCLAKWYHSNIYFQTGETHSCYHPAPHKISLDSLGLNPSALHNTPEKLSERQQMLRGERPKGCQYCWNIEDINPNLISDRQIRTGSLFKESRLEEIEKFPLGEKVSPDYIELSFSNTCNFKCGYCHPKASSRYLNEIKEFGPYKGVKNHSCDIDWLKIFEEEDNPYIEAWWRWWPELKDSLKILRITGGEPLLQQSTFKMLEFLNEYPAPQLELNVNSNLGMSPQIVEKFCVKTEGLLQKNAVKQFKLFTSLDTWGPQAEYIRTGLNLKTFEQNLKTYLGKTSSPVTFMITFNLFSVPKFSEFMAQILNWRSEFQWENPESQHRIRFDISYLKEPLQYDINILPKDVFMPYMDQHLKFIKDNTDDQRKDRFSFMEYQRFLRTYEYMKNTSYAEEKIQEGRQDFYNFFKEQDRRRNTKLVDTFPELQDFYQSCHPKAAAKFLDF